MVLSHNGYQVQNATATCGSSATELTLALQIGTSTLIGCETNPLGGVTTKLPQRGHVSPVEVSIAYAVTSAVETSPGFSGATEAALPQASSHAPPGHGRVSPPRCHRGARCAHEADAGVP
jgi:hypothetical protein